MSTSSPHPNGPGEALRGRTALVTGAGRGIGREVALQLAAAGADLALVARSAVELEEVAALARSRGTTALALPADLARAGEAEAVAARAGADLAPVDVLVNNAAVVWPVAASAALDARRWADAIALNLVAPAALSFALLPGMLERGWGRIVNVSSGIAAQPAVMVRGNAYVTSKAALEAHTVNLAAELAGSGVTVNAFRPGAVDTSMQEWLRDQDREQIGETLHRRYTGWHEEGELIAAAASARALVERLCSAGSGEVWEVPTPDAPR